MTEVDPFATYADKVGTSSDSQWSTLTRLDSQAFEGASEPLPGPQAQEIRGHAEEAAE